jgi:DNA-binding PadR family transcriptional regulator
VTQVAAAEDQQTPAGEELTPTALTILGYLALHPRSGYEIREAAKRAVSFFWGVSDGQLYPQLRLLAERGLIEAPAGQQGPRSRSVWQLTTAGRSALQSWLHAPSSPLRMRDENLVKLLFAARLEPKEAVRLIDERRRSFQWFREHLASVVPAADWSQRERADSLPIPQLVKDYGLRFAQAVLDWCDQCEAEVRKAAR